MKDLETFDESATKAIGKTKRRLDEGYAVNFEVGHARDSSAKDLTERMGAQDVIYRLVFEAACEFLFETSLRTLDSELLHPHTQSHSSDQSLASKLTREEAFSQALIGAETVLIDSRPLLGFFKDRPEPYMGILTDYSSLPTGVCPICSSWEYQTIHDPIPPPPISIREPPSTRSPPQKMEKMESPPTSRRRHCK